MKVTNTASKQVYTGGSGSKGKWRPLSLVGMASAVMVLNSSSVNIAISALVNDLDTTVSTIQAVLSLYALVTAVCMLPGAKLADRFGAKDVFQMGALLYGAGALVVALAQNGAMLLVGMSVVQGVAAALMMPTALALLSAAYPGEARAGALAAYSAVASASMAVAPLLAGALTTYVSWRLVFGLEVLLVAALLLRRAVLGGIAAPAPNRAARFDVPGSLLAMGALSCIIVGALLAKTYGWVLALRPFSLGLVTLSTVSPTALLLLAGLLLGGLLVAWLRHAKHSGRAGLIDVGLFKNRAFSVVLFTKLLAQLAVAGILFTVPLYLQNVLAYSALATGVSLLPLPVVLFATALVVVKLAAKMGRKNVILLGTLLLAAGACVMWLVFWGSNSVSGVTLLPAVALLGAGMGCMMSPSNTLALSSVPPKLANQGSGILTTTNNLASSLGTAITGSLLLGGMRTTLEDSMTAVYPEQFSGYSREELARLLAQAADKMRAAAPTIQNVDAAQLDQLRDTLVAALNSAMSYLMVAMALVAIAAAVIVFFGLPGSKKTKQGRAKENDSNFSRG